MSSFPIGSKVILHNLKKGSQYNGKNGVVKSNPNNDGRQNVLLNYRYGSDNTVAVKPENLKLVQDKALSSFPIGSNVMIQVTDGSEYNGKLGIVMSNLNDRGRQEVKLQDGKTVAVKPEHLSTKGCRQSKTGRHSKKKEKGRQCNTAAAAEEGKDEEEDDDDYWHKPQYFEFDRNGGFDGFVTKVKKGEAFATKMLAVDSSLASFTGNWSIQSTGILTSVLSYLRRCENESFERVMASLGGDLESPSLWVALLLKRGAEENCGTLQIAQKIGPLVRCMCNDTKRTFFRSNKHWKDTIVLFVQLITTMLTRAVNDSDGKMIIDTVLKYDGLLSTIVQWGFWGKEHRPDLVQELTIDNWPQFHIREVEEPKTEVCTDYISSCGSETLLLLVAHIDSSGRDDYGLELLLTIGSTPIVSKSYYDSCMVSCTAGLVRAIQDHFRLAGWDGDVFKNCLRVILSLVDEADCVDKGVITEVVDLGLNVTLEYSSAELITEVSFAMLCPYPNSPSDSRVAFAIRAGLVEMCLSLVDRFGIAGMGGSLLFKNIHHIFRNMKFHYIRRLPRLSRVRKP